MNGQPPPAGDRPLVHPNTGEVLDPDNLPDEARIALLEAAMADMQAAVDELLRKLAADAKGGRPSQWSWHHADPRRRAQMWAELAAFVDWLIGRYRPGNSAEIRRCWYRHPVAVEELWALMVAWRAAYCAGNRASDQLAAWHQHWLWPCLERLNTYAGWDDCGAAHRDADGVKRLPTDEAFADYARTPTALEPGPGDPAGTPIVTVDSAESAESPTQQELRS